MQTEFGGGVPESTTFAQTLGSLKENGSNMLLVGSDATAAHKSACQRLLGETNGNSRYRLVGVTDGQRQVCDDLHEEFEPIQVIEYGSSHELPGTEELSEQEAQPTDPLGEFGAALIHTVEEFEDEAGGLEPSELRVCLDSLVPLLEEYRSERVFRLLHMTTAQIKRSQGMGHYHLPVSRDHEMANLLEPLFDAVVELRDGNGGPEQRWHLRDQETTSDWVQI